MQKYTGRRLQEQAPSTARTERAFAAPAEKEDATPLLTPVEPAHATLAAPAEKQDATPRLPLAHASGFFFEIFFFQKQIEMPGAQQRGHAWGAEQRRWVGGAEAGPTDRLGAPRTTEGLVGQGRAPGVGSQHCAADATAGSRHSRPRGSQCVHAGERGGKMRVILRRIQRVYFRRNRRAGSRATSAAVRHRRRVHAHMRFSAVFHTKTLLVLGRSRD